MYIRMCNLNSRVRSVMKQNKICILDIEFKKEKHAELNPHYLFVQPKSFGDLEARLRKRKSDSEEQINLMRGRNLKPQKVCLSENF